MTLRNLFVGSTVPPDVAFDASAAGSWANSTTTCTVSITVGSGSNRALFVGFSSQDQDAGSGTTVSASSNVDGALTLVTGSDLDADVGTERLRAAWFVLVNPTSGSHTITCTTSATYDALAACAIAFSNVNQSTPAENVDTDDAGFEPTFPISDVITTADGKAVISMSTYKSGSNSVGIGAGTSFVDSHEVAFWGTGQIGAYVLSDASTETVQYTGGAEWVIISGLSVNQA